MAIRTTAKRVQAAIEVDDCDDLSIHITAASVLVDMVVACAARKGITLTADQLLWMETYLAADHYAHYDPQLKSKSTLSASASFETKDFAELAKRYDSSGCLAAHLDPVGPARAGGRWLGKSRLAAIPWYNR